MSNRVGLIGAGFVACGLISILAFVTWSLIYHTIPAENKEAVTLLLGVLSANVGSIVGFYFGSSSAGRAKDATIATLATQNTPTGGTP